MQAITTETMAIEQIKKKIKALTAFDKKKVIRYFHIAMITLFVIIAILLIHNIHINDVNYKSTINNTSPTNIIFLESQNSNINDFISDYFTARKSLDYNKIFSCYGRDYDNEKTKDEVGVKKIVDAIRYEKTYVLDYENLKIYTAPGYKKGDTVALVTYDMSFTFSEDKAPMIIIFYLMKDENSYAIIDKFDIGTSKYIMDCMNTTQVRSMYDEVKSNLEKVLFGNESLKLVYNTLRQYEMNMNGDLNYDETF